jgi:NAD(P)-dependent dehydrogenase (short-subunit alcohol dehydrogenase family)
LVSDSESQAAPLGAAVRRFDLSGRVVVVTGASKGIGRELTILLAETGAVVVPTVRTDADAASLASDAESIGLTVHPQQLDVRDVASRPSLASSPRAAASMSSSTTQASASPAPPSMSPRPTGTR